MALPAYNEEKGLPPLLANLEENFAKLSNLGYGHSYVIVDDGSKDNTLEIIKEHGERLPIAIVIHEQNKGLGPTIRDALKKASELANDDDIILTMDADNTHSPDLMIPIVKKMEEGYDVVIASRYRTGAQVVGLNWFRKLMSFGARVLFQIMFPISGVRDYTSGYRAYRAHVLKNAFKLYGDKFIEHQGFQSMADILLRLSRLDVKMTEVAMVLRYDLKGGVSSMRVGNTVLNTLKLLVARRLERKPDWARKPK